jgi:predicted GNAT family acetyltransferase
VTPDVAQYSVVDAPKRERFEIRLGDEVAGFTEYKLRSGLIAFVHTEVAPEHEGKGLASRLISGALDAARERGLAVLPFCPFVRGFIAQHPDEYLELVPSDLRRHFELPAND